MNATQYWQRRNELLRDIGNGTMNSSAIRVSSKQTKINFGSNRNKPKQDLFRVCFGLFRETKRKYFGLFRFFEPLSKQPKQTDLFHN